MRLSPSPSSPACLPRRLNPLPAPKRRAPRPPALPTAAPEVGTRGAREREPGATPPPDPPAGAAASRPGRARRRPRAGAGARRARSEVASARWEAGCELLGARTRPRGFATTLG